MIEREEKKRRISSSTSTLRFSSFFSPEIIYSLSIYIYILYSWIAENFSLLFSLFPFNLLFNSLFKILFKITLNLKKKKRESFVGLFLLSFALQLSEFSFLSTWFSSNDKRREKEINRKELENFNWQEKFLWWWFSLLWFACLFYDALQLLTTKKRTNETKEKKRRESIFVVVVVVLVILPLFYLTIYRERKS